MRRGASVLKPHNANHVGVERACHHEEIVYAAMARGQLGRDDVATNDVGPLSVAQLLGREVPVGRSDPWTLEGTDDRRGNA